MKVSPLGRGLRGGCCDAEDLIKLPNPKYPPLAPPRRGTDRDYYLAF